ncbi:MAG: DNA translocase FtsK 4TM domain-containing protein, partial [Bacteroidetes bacterium]|nr:DNA translocase FtsK 4TM domain-containing protein [Bacteroidota bacterium]
MAAKKKQSKSSSASAQPRVPKKPAPNKGLNLNLSTKLKEEIAGLLLMLFSVLMILAVVTHKADENPDSIVTLWKVGELKNLMGVVGAYLSYYLVFYSFGYAVVALPILSFVYGWLIFVHRSIFVVNAFAFYILTLMVLVSAWIALPDSGNPSAMWTSSGLLGGMMAHQLFVWLGRFGSIALWVVFSLIWVIMVTRISIADLVPSFQSIFVSSFRKTAGAVSRFKDRQTQLLDAESGQSVSADERPLVPEYLQKKLPEENRESGASLETGIASTAAGSEVNAAAHVPEPIIKADPSSQSKFATESVKVDSESDPRTKEKPRFINADPLTEEDHRTASDLQRAQAQIAQRSTLKLEKPIDKDPVTGSINYDTQLMRDIESIGRIDRQFVLPDIDTDQIKPSSGTIIPKGQLEDSAEEETVLEEQGLDTHGVDFADIARQGFEQEHGNFVIPDEDDSSASPAGTRDSDISRQEVSGEEEVVAPGDTTRDERSPTDDAATEFDAALPDVSEEKPTVKRKPVKAIEPLADEIDFDRENQAALKKYKAPSLDLLEPTQEAEKLTEAEIADLNDKIAQIIRTLQEFGIDTKVVATEYSGPVVAIYQLELPSGLKISKVTGLEDELALAMKVKSVRMIPVTSKGTIQVEIPKPKATPVLIRSLFEDRSFRVAKNKYRLGLALGKTIDGAIHFEDLAKMPHLLVAGTTGSGKSVGVNSMITSLLYQFDPSEVKFVMIDPKKVELALYRQLKNHHLICLRNQHGELIEDVITKPENAKLILKALVDEMEERYEKLAHANVRNIEDYNKRWADDDMPDDDKHQHHKLEYIVAIIDELADLMMTAPREIETSITRLAQMARAVGIHLVVATQRPSVDVLTGLIKANFPARIAYQVRSKIDSRTILDMGGAEQLLGKGDMLYLPPG